MHVFTDIEKLPQFVLPVLTIGTFDGVHPGHVKILKNLLEEARSINGTAVLITFYPHPKNITRAQEQAVELLTTPAEKYALLQKNGIENIVVVPFNRDFSSQSARQYVEDFLFKRFKPHTIIIGYDHRFGHNREGNFELLEQEAALLGFSVKEIPEKLLQDVIISSTAIRKALHAGDVTQANALLGYPYFFSGTVVKGRQLGRTIGFATANMLPDPEKLIPGFGVYAVWVDVERTGETFGGMLNIGNRPTVDGTTRSIEVHLFDFDADLYGETITVTLVERLRDETKFDGLPALQHQLAKDEQNARSILKNGAV